MSVVRRAGPYRLVRELGRGSAGVVYLGEHDESVIDFESTSTGLVAAVKVFHEGAGSVDAAVVRQTLARIANPHIVQVFGGGVTSGGLPYLAMELVRGAEPITNYVKRARLSLDQILALYLKICRTVALAHQKSVVHGDLKASNLLVRENGRPKVTGFGLGDGASAAQADIQALAAVLYELLTGQAPATSGPRTPSEVVQDANRARELRGLLDELLLKSLGPGFASVEEFAQEVARAAEREQGIAEEAFIRGEAPAIPRKAILGLGAAALLGAAGWVGWRWLAGGGRRP